MAPVAAQFAGLLIETAVVYRRVQAFGKDKLDRFGQPDTEVKESHRLPCRVTAPQGGRTAEERSTDVVDVADELFLEAGADILEDDVVTVLAAPLETADPETSKHIITKAVVKIVRPLMDGIGEHHIEAQLSSQRPATSVSNPEIG